MGVLVAPTRPSSTAHQRCNVNSKETDPMQSKLLVATKVFTVHLQLVFLISPPTVFLIQLCSSSIRLIRKVLHRPMPIHLLLFRAPAPFPRKHLIPQRISLKATSSMTHFLLTHSHSCISMSSNPYATEVKENVYFSLPASLPHLPQGERREI